MTRTRILVADGAAVFRAAVRNVLAREPDFDVAEAANEAEVIAAVSVRRFDVALIDFDLPPVGGVAAIKAVRERSRAEVVVWSLGPQQAAAFASIRAGASGYLDKEISPQGLVRALRGTARGEAPLSRELMALMVDAIHALDERQQAREQAAILSTREREVLSHVAAGGRNRQIAAALSISEFTVKRHVQNILRKLELSNRREAAALYRTAASVDGEALSL